MISDLIDDVKIRLMEGYAEGRILLSRGTCGASNSHLDSFCPGAVIPCPPWSSPDRHQLETLSAATREDAQELASTLAVVKLPDSMVEHVAALELYRRPFRAPVSGLALSESDRHELKIVADYLVSRYAVSTERMTPWMVSASVPNLMTTTYNPGDKCYLGIHLDSWDKALLPQRPLSTNRICLNLGREARYFQFLNLSLSKIYRLLYGATPPGEYPLPGSLNDLVKDFCLLHPSYPIVALRVAPGEAYIAPTENIFHDGSTSGSEHTDVNLTIRGDFAYSGE